MTRTAAQKATDKEPLKAAMAETHSKLGCSGCKFADKRAIANRRPCCTIFFSTDATGACICREQVA